MKFIYLFILVSLLFVFKGYTQEGLTQEMGTYAPRGKFVLDNQNNIYSIGGITEAEADETTILPNAPQPEYGGGENDGYIEKRNLDGALLWNTFIGGEGQDGVTISGFYEDDIYLNGTTTSTTSIATVGAFQEEFLDNEAGGVAHNNYLMKINQVDGTKEWGTYLRSSADGSTEHITNSAVDSEGNLYVVGYTQSSVNIATPDAYDQSLGEADTKSFIYKFDPDGNRLWSTYYGTSGSYDVTTINNIAIDLNGNIIVGGIYVGATTPDDYFISEDPPYNDGVNIGYDVVLAKFDANGSRIWGLMYGGVKEEFLIDLKVDLENNILLFGSTESPTDIATPGAYQENFGSSNPINATDDAFLAKFGAEGNLLWATYYGGYLMDSYGDGSGASGNIYNRSFLSIALDENNNIFIAAQTESEEQIATEGTYQDSLATSGQYDAYIAKFTPSGERLWGTYFGGTEDEKNIEILYAGDDQLFLSGTTASSNAIATDNAWWEDELQGDSSYFLTKFSLRDLSVETHEEEVFKLYPNPTSGAFTLTGKKISNAKVQIFDVQGRLIKTFSDLTIDQPINPSLESGLYFVRIEDEKAYQILKLIVE